MKRQSLLWVLLLSSVVVACTRPRSRRHIYFAVVGDDPEGLLGEAVFKAASRWATATGVDIQLVDAQTNPPHVVRWANPEEMPWSLDNPPVRLGGVSNPTAQGLGGKSFDKSLILVRNTVHPSMLEATVTHEMGHVISQRDGHPASGVLSNPVNDPQAHIDEASLAWVCENLECEFSIVEPDPAAQVS
jgi:hypothetical protein